MRSRLAAVFVGIVLLPIPIAAQDIVFLAPKTDQPPPAEVQPPWVWRDTSLDPAVPIPPDPPFGRAVERPGDSDWPDCEAVSHSSRLSNYGANCRTFFVPADNCDVRMYVEEGGQWKALSASPPATHPPTIRRGSMNDAAFELKEGNDPAGGRPGCHLLIKSWSNDRLRFMMAWLPQGP
jgi:hypothetical protein